MKKITLAEAATRVVMNLPQEDLHEGYGHPDMKKVVSYLEGFLKNVKQDSDIDQDEAEEMKKTCSEQIDYMGINSNWYDPMHSIILAQWSILSDATSAIHEIGVSNSVKSIVKKDLAAIKSIIKVKV